MELELLTLLILHIVGISIFGKFESESPWWRHVLKWIIIITITWVSWYYMGHYSLIIIGVLSVVSLIVHFVWCHQNGINPIQATPRRKYYNLRKWSWKE